jgi:hypothetical protein
MPTPGQVHKNSDTDRDCEGDERAIFYLLGKGDVMHGCQALPPRCRTSRENIRTDRASGAS